MRLLTGKTILFIVLVLVAGAAPLLTADLASGWENVPCDFLTGGGWILPPWNTGSVKANFAIAGGCKNGSGINGVPYWGHLNYLDHGTPIKPATAPTPFHVHWTSIEAYVFVEDGSNGTDPKTHQPVGTREVCGTATTNDPAHPVVHFRVRVHDDGEPGTRDTFYMHLSDPATNSVFYDTGNNYLGGGGGGGGNIQLHKPNPSTTGDFNNCPYP